MTTINCPHCQQAVAYNPQMGGMTVACPHCSQHFIMPGGQAPASAPAAHAGHGSSGGYGGRHEEDDYYEEDRRSSGPSPGMIIGIVFGVIAVVVGLPLLICGGLMLGGVWKVNSIASEVKEEKREELKMARKMTDQALANFGYGKSSNLDMQTGGGETYVDGRTRKGGRSLPFVATFKVTKRSKLASTWKLLRVEVNGEEIYKLKTD